MATEWKAPGYAEAVAREQQLREEAYLNAPSNICGVRVKQITPRLLGLLNVIQSPWTFGGQVTPGASIQFLWTLANDFTDRSDEMRDWFTVNFVRRITEKEWDWEYVFDSIGEFVDDTFMDAPTGGTESTPYASTTAWLEVRMRKFMGWDSETTLNTPLRRIYQLLRCEQIMDGDRTIVNKYSDAANDAWIKQAMSDPEMIAAIQRGNIKLN